MNTLLTSPSIEGLLLAIRDGAGCADRDGSYYPNEKVGAAAWIIITPDGTEWIEGGGVLPCPADVQNSYRSELKCFGLISALLDTWNDIPVVARPQ